MTVSETRTQTEITPMFSIITLAEALAWLSRSFGFTEELQHPKAGGMHART